MPAPDFFRGLGLFILPNFLEPGYAAEICRLMEAAPAKPALVVGQTGEGRLDLDSRKVDCSFIPEETRTPLSKRLSSLLPDLQKHFGLSLAGCESPEFLVYHPGDFFKPHLDRGAPLRRNDICRRRISLVIFLNRRSDQPSDGTYGGGHLTLYGLLDGHRWERCGLPLNAEPGLLVGFPSDKWHEVRPVLHGRRFTVVTWFYGPETATLVEETLSIRDSDRHMHIAH
jgi:SM-20-related protein